MSQIPTGWLMKIEGLGETPLTTGFNDDRWYTKVGIPLVKVSKQGI